MTRATQKISELQQNVVCNLCGANDCNEVYPARYSSDDDAPAVLDRFKRCGGDMLLDRVVRCTRCGLVYINPRLRDDVLLQEYSDGSIHGYREQFVAQNEGRSRAFRKSIRRINAVVSRPGKLLDVGAADGTFMAVAREQGWDVRGCEPNTWFCRWGGEQYGLRIDRGTLFEQPYPAASFDVITLWDVIEHVADPKRLIMKCRDLIKPHGVLVCTYPDIGSWIARLMGRRWVFLMSVHLYYFTRATIGLLLRQCGFTVEHCSPHFQILQAGYIAFRMQTHSDLLHRLCSACLALTRSRDRMLPYWVGINCIIARAMSSQGAPA